MIAHVQMKQVVHGVSPWRNLASPRPICVHSPTPIYRAMTATPAARPRMPTPATENPARSAAAPLALAAPPPDEELPPAVADARADEMKRDASASSEELDEVTSEQILLATDPIAVGRGKGRRKEG